MRKTVANVIIAGAVSTNLVIENRLKSQTLDEIPKIGSVFVAARFGFIDVLRFIAATVEMIQHVFERSSHAALVAVTSIFSSGVFGVVLFFMISGFVMPLSM